MFISSSKEITKDQEDEWFLLSLDEKTFDEFFKFSDRLTPLKDVLITRNQDLYDEYLQKKVFIQSDEKMAKFCDLMKLSVQQFVNVVNNRVEGKQTICPIVKISFDSKSSDSESSKSVCIIHEFPDEELIGKLTLFRTPYLRVQ